MSPLELLYSLGLSEAVFLPIPIGEKGPRFRGWQTKTRADMQTPAYFNSFSENTNIGVLLGAKSNNLCVIDIDLEEWVQPFLAANPSLETTLRTRGNRGCSFWIRVKDSYPKAAKIKDLEGNDVMEWRADGQQSVIYGRHPRGMNYRFIVSTSPVEIEFKSIRWPRGLNLPRSFLGGCEESVTSSGVFNKTPQADQAVASAIIEDARKYVAKMPASVSGEGGHGKTFAVACALVKGFDLSPSEAMPILEGYSLRCDPPWSQKELQHKLLEADEQPDTQSRGYLILARKRFANLESRAGDRLIELPGNNVSLTESARKLFELIAPAHTMFIRGRRITELVGDADTRYHLQIVTPSAFRSRAEAWARLMAWRIGRDGKPVLKPVVMPEETAKALLDTKEAPELLPHIKSIINCAVLMPDGLGSRIIGPGYDPSGLLVTGGVMPPDVPLEEAVSSIKRLIEEFDFTSPGDRSRALASILTPALKLGGHILGFVPADVAEADQSQAGKTYRQRIIAAIYNEIPANISKRDGGVGSVDESLAQKLLGGSPFIQLDNMRGRIDSQYLESLLTADKVFSVRVPHHGEIEINPEGFFIFLTSNGVEATQDFANRSSIIRIKKRKDHVFKQYNEGDLLLHVRACQAYYLGCVFAIIREWIRQGRQKTNETGHDFREWVQVLDWIVQRVLKEAPLMLDHEATKERISNPAMTFLRRLALALRDGQRLGEELCAAAISDFCEDEGIVVPGQKQESQQDGYKAIGRLMGKIFQRGAGESKVTLDGFVIERSERSVIRQDGNGRMPQKIYIFRSEEPSSTQLNFPTNPTQYL